MSRLRSVEATLGYGDQAVVRDLSLAFADGAITAIVGPNGCGKSTLLRALARLHRPSGGAVVLDGQAIHRLPTREVARRLGLLAQQPAPLDGITVADLARRGRFPHQTFLQPPSRHDADAVERALAVAGMGALRERRVDELSGGQRQRAWIAMALAQETQLLLLDEPTTFLDLAHQRDVADLLRRLNAEEGRTIVMVLHDVNEAVRIGHRLVAMRAGRVVREGPPEAVIEPGLLRDLYGVDCDVYPHPSDGLPFCVPRGDAPRPGTTRTAPAPHPAAGITVDRLRVRYGAQPVLHGLSVAIPGGAVTAIVGPNGCGKSTLLRAMARLVTPGAGVVRVAGRDVRSGSRRALARRLALLGQGATVPPGVPVEDLVALGRMPHQRWWRRWLIEDEAAVGRALADCGVAGLRGRDLETLSGGQRQRAWIAMALAQETPLLLLDEPTTFLDPGAQVELLDLIATLNRATGRTVVMVLHDLNLAARAADWLIAMREGRIVAAGPPAAVVTPALVRDVFGVDAIVVPDPRTGAPMVLPRRTSASGDAPPPRPTAAAGVSTDRF